MKKRYSKTLESRPSVLSKMDVRIFILFFILLLNNSLFAQGATCGAASPITVNGPCLTNDNIQDSPQTAPNIGTCTGTFMRQGWYTFTVTGGPKNITITASSADRNLFLQLISSSTGTCAGVLSQIACANADNNNNSAQTETITQLLNNGTYFIKVVNVGTQNRDLTLNSLCITSPCIAPTSQASGFAAGTISSTAFPATFSGTADGYLVIRSTSSTPPSQPVNGTTYTAANVTTLGAGLSFVQSSASTSIAGTGLTGNTQYYYYIYAYNNTCTGGPVYATGGALTGNAITCPAVPNSVATASVTTTGFTLNWAAPTGGSAAAITYTVQVTTDSGYTTNVAGSPFSIAAPTVTLNLSGLNPSTTYYYRILASNSCSSAYVTGNQATANPPCTTPVGQATGFTLGTITSASIPASFSGTATSYLVIRSTSSTPPSQPVNGTTYSAANIATLGTGLTFIQAGAATTITGTGLAGNTQYYYYIFAYNTTGCTGGPLYNTAGPLTGNGITCPAVPNSASITGITSSGFTANWAAPTGGSASPITYTLQVTTDAGYTNNVPGSPFTIAAPTTTYTLTGLSSGTAYYCRLLASNGCSSAYVTGTVTTTITNDNCSGAIAITPASSCTYTTYTNSGATASTGIPAPGCGNYSGGDIWFSVVVPASGKITINSQAGVMTDGAMAVYSGTCGGTMTLIQCDDDSGVGAMPYLNLTGLAAGTTIYIRFWEYGNDNNGTFGLCVTTPTPCTAGPGTGTTTLTCPSVVSGGLGLSGADPATFSCYASSNCVDLEATFPTIAQTTSYTVSSIPYAPPYQFNCLQNQVSVNIDDIWSSTVNLPFNFCFYGNNYSQCLIGSNGTLTFDMTNNTPGGYSTWSFANNLPSNNLFLNTIFGVYHDIDPSKGGQVGWELITLNNGCRALVASWSDVPMYSDNSILYTGMMVLYENTNIIDVYIKQKKIDNNNVSPWNGGNAVVGIQNATGTAATVAPNRNSLDTNWNATNEAWRFTPSGASVTSIKWYQGAGTTGPVVGTTSTINVCPTATTTYTAEVTYALCTGNYVQTDQTTVSITTGKTWNGSVDTDWNKANNWTPSGVPTNADCVIIPNVTNKPIISGTGYNAYCYNLTIQNGGTLQLNSANNITVTDFVKVNTGGGFTVKSTGNLVQINNTAANSGSITMERTTNVRNYDYVYWASPVVGFNSGAISPGTSSYYIYKWDPTVANTNGGQGSWVPGVETMSVAKGYIVRGPDAYSSNAPYTATFTGVPNNGIIQPTIARGSFTGANYAGTNGITITNLDDNWNLVGNPYPSSINATTFLANNTNLDGNIRVWTHGSPISASNPNPFYGTFVQNYTVNDYVSYNGTGSTPPGYNGKIGAGQGFFVVMNDGAATTSTVTFNNSLRSSAYDNSQFYKSSSANANATFDNEEKHRIWLSLVDGNSSSATTLIGYVSNATYEKDRMYDAPYKVVEQLSLYSLLNSNPMIIQGRPIPFDDNDFIPLGISIPFNGVYTVAINQVDGLFENQAQNIYLEDTYNHVVYDLRQAPYSFSANAGNYEDRFILRYKTAPLGNATFDNSNTYGFINEHTLHVKSTQSIKQIDIFDIAGKHVITYKPDSGKNSYDDHFPYADGVYIANIKLDNNKTVTQKLLN